MKNSSLQPLSLAAITLRILLGLVVFPHGAQKLFGWFGGYGFTGTMQYFTGTVGLPWIIGFLVIMLESIGAIALIAGLGTRAIAAAYIILAVGIVFTSHVQHGFFSNWFGNQKGEGFEYFLLWIGMALALLMIGGGQYAVERIIKTSK
ncbi:DoxX family protein [Lacibacter sediminis]|uniref:DoxX family protein n=1 Tax=Lacibacter sediminis TaxID=2760713 RepID=A0A7G5XDC7_9BACT|nr:DoxX family protein [Lacibacter sediminis]QNA43480.1 DoxX family protein [Lacibacter sediminis]